MMYYDDVMHILFVIIIQLKYIPDNFMVGTIKRLEFKQGKSLKFNNFTAE